MSGFRVVVCGGGIAAVEGLLRLRRLAGDSVDVCLMAPNDDLVMRPLAVREPFAAGPPSSYPLQRIVADTDAEWKRDSLAWVERDSQLVHPEAGEAIRYDALLVATGARQVPAFSHIGTFRDDKADETFQGVIQDIEGGYTKSVAFLLPSGPVYPLPLYELALMTAERARGMDVEVDFTLATPEEGPLAVFGKNVGDAISERLEAAGFSVYCGAEAVVPAAQRLVLQPQAVELHPGRMIAMPRIEGPAIRGLSTGGHGFVPIDQFCCVPDTDGRIYAAGDAADYPIKHGGLGAQMADTAANAITRLSRGEVAQAPFHPVIRGKVLGGDQPLYISAHLVGGKGFESQIHHEPPWPEDEKVVAEELGPYLAGLDTEGRSAATR